MVTVGDIYNYIDTFAPFHTAMGFDNVGLLVGEKHCPVTSVIVSMDITPEVISEAVSQNAELIISHHPDVYKRQFFSNVKARSALPVLSIFVASLASSFLFLLFCFLCGLSIWGAYCVPLAPLFRCLLYTSRE